MSLLYYIIDKQNEKLFYVGTFYGAVRAFD